MFLKKRKIRAGITVPKCFKIPNKNTYSYEKTTGLRSLIELNKKQALYWQKGHLEDCGVCFLFLPVLFRVKDAPEILIFFLPKWICNILEMTFSNSKERLRLGGTYLRGKVSCFLWQGLVWKNYLNSIPFCAAQTFMTLRMWYSWAASPHHLYKMSSALGKLRRGTLVSVREKKTIRFHSSFLFFCFFCVC